MKDDLRAGAGRDSPDVEHVHGLKQATLIGSLFVNFGILYALYNGVITVLLPNQIALIDPVNKAGNFSLVMFITLLFTIFATPLAGALSDRTRGRWGRRSPWIVFGSLAGSLAVLSLVFMKTIPAIAACMVVMSFAYNMAQGPLTTVVADRFDADSRGKASGFIGSAQTVGGMIGIVMAGYLASELFKGYAIFAMAIAVSCVAFVLVNRERPSTDLPVEPFKLGRFLSAFWVNPLAYPDFGWAFLGRFAMYLGIQATISLQLYILQDYIHLGVAASNHAVANMSVITSVSLIVSGLVSGFLSDLWKTYKYFVVFASLVMAAALAVPVFVPTLTGMYAYAGIFGLGYAAFIAIDLALITRVLPNRANTTARDMGVMTIANVVPQALSPLLAVPLLKHFHNDYAVVFIAAIACVCVSSLCILPIKSVR